MEWINIEKKWHEMASRLQASDRMISARKGKETTVQKRPEQALTDTALPAGGRATDDRTASGAREMA